MDRDIESAVRKCSCCINVSRDSPVLITEWEMRPWCHIAIDIAGPKTDCNGKVFYVLAVVDVHSKYVAAKVLSNVKSTDVIDFLQSLFMIFVFCLKLTLDNGPQFTSAVFVDFLRSHGISHIRSSVFNPQSNGQIERVNKNLKKVLENARLQQVSVASMNSFLQKYLFSYNNTVHETLNACPSHMLLKFVPRTYINSTARNDPTHEDFLTSKKEEIEIQTEKRANYADERRKPVFTPVFKVGDWVLSLQDLYVELCIKLARTLSS